MAGNGVDQDYQAIKDDITKLRSDMNMLLESLTDEAKSRSAEAGAKAREQFDNGAAKVKARAQQANAEVREQIEDKPLLYLLGSFAIGMLLGQLFNRR